MSAIFDPILGKLKKRDPDIISLSKKVETLLSKDGSNYEGGLTLVAPTITSSWIIFDKSGNQIKTSKANALSIEHGASVNYTGSFKYSAPNSSQKAPSRCDGAFGTTLPTAGNPCESISSDNITSNKTFTANLYANKGGLEVSGNKVVRATGEDKTSASASVTFCHRRYYGVSADINQSITSLATTELVTTRGKTITFDCSGGKYFFIAYPTALGKATFNIGGLTVGIDPTTTTITNEYGLEVEYYVYRSADLQTGSAIKVIIS